MRRDAKASSTSSAHAAGSTAAAGPRARGLFGLACLCVLGLAAFLGSSAPSVGAAESFPGQGFLPDNRAWEMVSPPDKNGGGIGADTQRTRAAADGDAIGFISLAGFADVAGSSVAVDYIAQRSEEATPGDSGWRTHGIMPEVEPGSWDTLLGANAQAMYDGQFSPSLDSGFLIAKSPVVEDPWVSDVTNLFRRTDLRSAGAGFYELVSQCPRCAEPGVETALPPYSTGGQAAERRPYLVGASANLEQVVFESQQRLTADTPEEAELAHLFEWDGGVPRLAGRIPIDPAIECDDVAMPACAPADVSIGGIGVGASHFPARTAHAVSDGSDGHLRVIFTRPTNATGTSVQANGFEGNLYMREDGRRTVKLNASERTPPAAFVRASYMDASTDGTRVFFMSGEPLTNDAPASAGVKKLYMYDVTKPAAAPDNLTLLSKDAEPADGASGLARGIIGVSADGRYAYMAVVGQLVKDAPALGTGAGIYLWHEGTVTYVGRSPSGTAQLEVIASNGGPPKQARVTGDGKHLLFTTINGSGLLQIRGGTDYNHGGCVSSVGTSCREVYLYSAETDTLVCASCNPSGAPATANATTQVRELIGGAVTSSHENSPLSANGRYVFFSSAEALDPIRDTNGVSDAYVFDSSAGTVHLLSSGRDSSASYFMEASADGSDAFFLTREQLVGWDVDGAYDLYDARVGGGFPEPPPRPPSCAGDACQPAPLGLSDPTPGSAATQGPGDPALKRGQRRRCPRGKRRVKTRGGRARCVKRQNSGKRAANNDRRAGR